MITTKTLYDETDILDQIRIMMNRDEIRDMASELAESLVSLPNNPTDQEMSVAHEQARKIEQGLINRALVRYVAEMLG